MTLLPDNLTIPTLYATEGQGKSVLAVAHLSHPVTGWHWYVLERGTGADADLVFGLVGGFELEYGYSDLQELEANGVVFDTDWTPEEVGVIEQDARRIRGE